MFMLTQKALQMNDIIKQTVQEAVDARVEQARQQEEVNLVALAWVASLFGVEIRLSND